MAAESSAVIVERNGVVLTVMLNRPNAANALDPAMLDGLAGAFDAAAAPDVRVVVLGGRGRNFCAGADLKAATADPAGMDLRSRFNPLLLRLVALDKPIVAAINGAAAGGGLGLALAADLRVMGQSARLVPAWSSLGLVPDVGASWFLARMLGPARATTWVLSGSPMGSEEACLAGLAGEIVADGFELEAAIAVARRLAALPGPAVALTRALFADAPRATLAEQIEAEARAQAIAMRHPDQIAAQSAVVATMSGRR